MYAVKSYKLVYNKSSGSGPYGEILGIARCEQNVNESISTSSGVMLVAHSDTKAHTFSSNLMAMSYAVDIKPVEDDF